MNTDLPSDQREHRTWLLSRAEIPAGGTWVDLGCGQGVDLLSILSQQPLPALRLIGLDANAEALAVARRQPGADDPRVEFRVHKLGDALPFASASVDVAYSNNLLECLPDRDAFAHEVARVVKPGGWTVMAHWDWDSQLFDSADKHLIRGLVSAFSDWQQPWMDHADGWMGRRLWGTFATTGLFEGSIHARVLTNIEYAPPWYGHARAQDFGALVELGLVSQEQYNRFLTEQEELNRRGKYFYSLVGYVYVGQRIA